MKTSGVFECSVYDGYWKPVETNVTRRIVRSITDAGARSLAVQNGEIDIASDVLSVIWKPLPIRKMSKYQNLIRREPIFIIII